MHCYPVTRTVDIADTDESSFSAIYAIKVHKQMTFVVKGRKGLNQNCVCCNFIIWALAIKLMSTARGKC